MKILVNISDYKELEKRSDILEALENGGVDNWMWYGESIDKIETNESFIKPYNGIEFSIGQEVYYNNNKAEFCCYFSKSMALIIVEAFPDFELIEISNHCQGCNIGDSDNKLTCNCDEISNLIEDLENSAKPNYIPLIVNINSLFEKPILVSKHEDRLKEITERKMKEVEKFKILQSKNIDLLNEIEKNEKIKESLKGLI